MCTFITTVLPPDADAARVRDLALGLGLGWHDLPNRRLQEQVEQGSKWFLATRKMCDCGTGLGAAGLRWRSSQDDPAAEVPRLRTRGWSETKIRRWLDQKGAVAARREESRSQAGEGPTPEIEAWTEFLRTAVISKATSRVGVPLHDYHGRVEGEKIAVMRRESVPLDTLSPRQLAFLEYDVLYEFGSAARASRTCHRPASGC
jgi:hypothetical protein